MPDSGPPKTVEERLKALEEMAVKLTNNDLAQNEGIRQALELVRSSNAAIEILLRDKYRAAT